MIRTFAILSILSLAASLARAEEKTEQAALQGAWQATSAEFAGAKWPEAIVKNLQLILENDTYCVNDGGGTDKGKVKLESNGKVESMVITGTDGPNKGKTFLAQYELKGDTLTICYDLDGKQVPAEFKTRPNTKLFLVTYKRNIK